MDAINWVPTLRHWEEKKRDSKNLWCANKRP
jgi:hypothetical protein